MKPYAWVIIGALIASIAWLYVVVWVLDRIKSGREGWE